MAHPSCGLWVFSRLACTRRSSWPLPVAAMTTSAFNVAIGIKMHQTWININNHPRSHYINQACVPNVLFSTKIKWLSPWPSGSSLRRLRCEYPFLPPSLLGVARRRFHRQMHRCPWQIPRNGHVLGASYHVVMLSSSLCTVYICIHLQSGKMWKALSPISQLGCWKEVKEVVSDC